MRYSRNAIALLITVMFVIVISVALGYGLQALKQSNQVVAKEKFLYQSSALIEDVLKILKNSPDMKQLEDDNATTQMYLFLAESAYIPLEFGGIKVVLSFSSARSKFNPNQLFDNKEEIDAFKKYLQKYMIDALYADILLDNMRIVTEKNRYDSYSSRIFDENPDLFREYIASKEHLDAINDFYKVEYHNENINNIDFDKLFYYSKNRNTAIDLNYATPEVWEMILGVDRLRAEELSAGSGSYSSVEDLGLLDEEKKSLKKFQTSFYEPYLLVKLKLMSDVGYSEINFEYDIRSKKGYGFVFKI